MPIPFRSVERLRALAVGALLICASQHIALGEEIESPAAILQRARAPEETIAMVAVDSKALADWRGSIDSFSKTITQLPPKDAVRQWLTLVDQLKSFGPSTRSVGPQFSDLFKALPTANQWSELQTQAADRLKTQPQSTTNQLINLLATVLGGDADSIRQALAAIDSSQIGGQQLSKILEESTGAPEDAATVAANFEKDVDSSSQNQLEIPDLVTLCGAARAETLLRKAVLVNRQLVAATGDATVKLTRRLAVEMIDQLPRPQWEMCDSIEATQLFEALQKRFPGPTTSATQPTAHKSWMRSMLSRNGRVTPFDEDAYSLANARQYYLIALIAQNRIDEALAVAKTVLSDEPDRSYLPYDALEKLDQAGLTANADNFLTRDAVNDPGMPYWDELAQVAAKLGKTLTILQIARDAGKTPGLSSDEKRIVDNRLAIALLAANQVDEGVAQLRACYVECKDDPAMAVEIATRLATVGRIITQPAIVKEGLDDAAQTLRRASNVQLYNLEEWFREERIAQRLPEIVAVLGDQLANPRGNNTSRGLLIELARAYYFANRPADVLAVFNTFPQWNITDLIDDQTNERVSSDEPPVTFLAAWALAGVGRNDDAARVLNYVLQKSGGFDPAYALLLKIDSDPISKLDTLFARDRFEERPLIWKAIFLQQAGKLDEAEKVCRQAIAIDPSDGEEGKGDRMRAYSVLADVLAAKGDTRSAENFRQAVRAIRLAEDADDAWQSDLLNRAVQMYRDALTHFTDAYCIQSRLAVQLASLGEYDEAAAHYRKAYELMPESFGRVESHCFGCEGAVRGAKAQNIAEDVFTKLIANGRPVPQVHYLLGYLRTEQDRWPEALNNFKEAVGLDPDYLNAWKKIAECDGHLQLSQQDREDAALAEMRLDPLCKHSEPDVEKFHDLKKLRQAADAATRQRPAKPASLYPLAAATAAIGNNVGPGRKPVVQNSWYENETTKAATGGDMMLGVTRVKEIVEEMGFGMLSD